MKIFLIVIRCKDIDKTKKFYEKFGLSFIKESYEGNPENYLTEIEGLTFKIEPCSKKKPVCKTTLGFSLPKLENKIKLLARDAYIHKNKKVYVFEDPDGRRVKIHLH